MGAYHQMGHDSWNLIPEEGLDNFAGLILSPINATPAQVEEKLAGIENRKSLDVVLDPQFYIPHSVKGKLPTWPYLDSSCETKDLGDADWWRSRCSELVGVARQIECTSVCSPAILPRVFEDAYYDAMVNYADQLADLAVGHSLDVLLTVVVPFRELAVPGRAERLASIVTRSPTTRLYLIFYDDLTAREQWTDAVALGGAMRLISALEAAGTRVLVGYCGLDVILWKFAGATSAATGKFLNLRRFGQERWQDIDVGGRVVEYWTERSLVTLLRENDVRLLQSRLPGLLSVDANPFSRAIVAALGASPREAWRGLSWRQYLWWFASVEAQLSADRGSAVRMLSEADANWRSLEQSRILLFDRNNDGSWIRPWLNAIYGFE